MKDEVKDVVLTILKGREYVFSLFHRLLGAEPTDALLEAACQEESLEALSIFLEDDAPEIEELQTVLMGLRGVKAADLKDEYTRLFLGPEDLIAPPWESVYRSSARALFQESTLAVGKWYAQYGFKPKESPHFPDDHISLEMHFMELTSARAAAALAAGQDGVYRDLLAAQLLFEQNHLLPWLGAYADDMKKSESKRFYPQLAAALHDVMNYDNRLLLDIMEAEGA